MEPVEHMELGDKEVMEGRGAIGLRRDMERWGS
jgi:hypothetical protein